jgi:outer membrane protein TolC
MFKRARWGVMILGLALLLAPVAAGAAGNGTGPVLNLEQLTEMALKFSPDVQVSRSEVKLAKEQKNEVHGYRYPQFDATALGGVVPKTRLPVIPLGAGTQPSRLFSPDSKNDWHGTTVFGHLDFTVIQPLYAFGKIAYREEAAAKNVKVKEEGVVAKQGEIIAQVSQAYYGLILANQGKEAVKEARSYLSDTKERINKLIIARSPNVKETDKYRLAAYEGAVEKSGAEAEEGAKTAYIALKALTNYQGEFQVPCAPPWICAPNSSS